jgi:hypothetical protein
MDNILDMTATNDCAFIIIMHLSKMTTVGALDRIFGTEDFRAAARSICIVSSDLEDPKQRVMTHAKFNNGGYGQHIDRKVGVVIDGFCILTDDEIVCGKKAESEGRDKPSASLEEAENFIINILGDDEYAKKDDIEKKAEERRIK